MSSTAAGRARRPVRRGAVLIAGPALALALAGTVAVAFEQEESVGGQVPLSEPAAVPSASVAQSPAPTPSSEPAAPAEPVTRVPVRDAAPPQAVDVAAPVRVQVADTVDVDVRPVGVDPDGTMELPGSGDVAGWYRFGAAPADEAGTTVLASHVDTSEGVGAFAALADVEPGDRVRVTDADGAVHDYTVRTVERFHKSGTPLETIFDRTGEPRLALVTCGGRWDADAGHYEDNLVVTAVP
ncbi:hypothetical protein GCM10023216_18600 [Isoptericola chiayiensis]|uniref:Peptidase C60 sortase A and B n=1 Tax=Isoptericola chiayiensis TaxID=579446 RepID=A0ABP8YHB1_9MICO|nr:class F sortase [Isoptericola chiayiensis]NOW00089.1 plastocyanin [Isoptericola chiayiensis]